MPHRTERALGLDAKKKPPVVVSAEVAVDQSPRAATADEMTGTVMINEAVTSEVVHGNDKAGLTSAQSAAFTHALLKG